MTSEIDKTEIDIPLDMVTDPYEPKKRFINDETLMINIKYINRIPRTRIITGNLTAYEIYQLLEKTILIENYNWLFVRGVMIEYVVLILSVMIEKNMIDHQNVQMYQHRKLIRFDHNGEFIRDWYIDNIPGEVYRQSFGSDCRVESCELTNPRRAQIKLMMKGVE